MKKLIETKNKSYHRQILIDLIYKNRSYYNGIVLDIGGRERNIFKILKKKVDKWIIVDLDKKHKPDLILDVSNMKEIDTSSIDVINAIELFEHVKLIKKAIKECYRILKNNGYLICSVPFLFYIHGAPNDYQRWTYLKWNQELKSAGFRIEKFIIMGRYFTHLTDTIKIFMNYLKNYNLFGKLLSFFIWPLIKNLSEIDKKEFVRKDPVLGSHHTGYFIIAQK